MAFRHLETSLHRIHQSFFEDVQEIYYEFLETFAYIEHHLIDFIQVTFFDSWDAEKEIAWPIDSLIHWLYGLRQNRFLRRPEVILFLWSIRLIKTSLKRLRPSRFIRSPGCRILDLKAFRNLEASLQRLHQIRFLRRLEGVFRVLRTIRLIKTSHKKTSKSLF
jgi:hypothetical protein